MLIRSISGHERLVEILERVIDHAVVVDLWARPGGISLLEKDTRIVVLVGDVTAAVTQLSPPNRTDSSR